jgi:hypothetical protein
MKQLFTLTENKLIALFITALAIVIVIALQFNNI